MIRKFTRNLSLAGILFLLSLNLIHLHCALLFSITLVKATNDGNYPKENLIIKETKLDNAGSVRYEDKNF